MIHFICITGQNSKGLKNSPMPNVFYRKTSVASICICILQLCVILEPMQELMSRHKAYALSPRDCLKTTLFQKWQKMVAPPGKSLKTTSMKPKSVIKHGRDFSETLFFCHPDLTQFFFVETTRPTKNRRKRKGAAAATGGGGGGPAGGGGGMSNKKRSPGHNFPLASQVTNKDTLFDVNFTKDTKPFFRMSWW